jgi:hypothetical protein
LVGRRAVWHSFEGRAGCSKRPHRPATQTPTSVRIPIPAHLQPPEAAQPGQRTARPSTGAAQAEPSSPPHAGRSAPGFPDAAARLGWPHCRIRPDPGPQYRRAGSWRPACPRPTAHPARAADPGGRRGLRGARHGRPAFGRQHRHHVRHGDQAASIGRGEAGRSPPPRTSSTRATARAPAVRVWSGGEANRAQSQTGSAGRDGR